MIKMMNINVLLINLNYSLDKEKLTLDIREYTIILSILIVYDKCIKRKRKV